MFNRRIHYNDTIITGRETKKLFVAIKYVTFSNENCIVT